MVCFFTFDDLSARFAVHDLHGPDLFVALFGRRIECVGECGIDGMGSHVRLCDDYVDVRGVCRSV